MPVVENEVWRSVGRDQTPESTNIQIENTWRSARGHHWEFPMGSVRGWIWGLSAKGLRQRVGLGGSVPGHLLHGTGTQVKLVQVIKAVRCPGQLGVGRGCAPGPACLAAGWMGAHGSPAS